MAQLFNDVACSNLCEDYHRKVAEATERIPDESQILEEQHNEILANSIPQLFTPEGEGFLILWDAMLPLTHNILPRIYRLFFMLGWLTAYKELSGR